VGEQSDVDSSRGDHRDLHCDRLSSCVHFSFVYGCMVMGGENVNKFRTAALSGSVNG
jgi:hypothetical protein